MSANERKWKTDETGRSQSSKNLISRFRAKRGGQPLQAAEKRLICLFGVQLCFLPWALGSMHLWAQWINLALSTLEFSLVLVAPGNFDRFNNVHSSRRRGGISRLVRFPPFWSGCLLLFFIAVQGLNPSFRYVTDGRSWWLIRMQNISWLPSGIDSPFIIANCWRQILIYGSAWMSLCAAWAGITRKRSVRILLGVLTVNAVLLGSVLAAQRISGDSRMPWPLTEFTHAPLFSSFIYHNHAGAYFALMTFSAISLSLIAYDEGTRGLKKSTPVAVLVLSSFFTAGAVVFTFSRGASLTLALGAIIFGIWFSIRCWKIPKVVGTEIRVKMTMVALFSFLAVYALFNLDFTTIYSRFERVVEQRTNEVNISSRLEARAAGRAMLADGQWLGIGSGGFRFLFPVYVSKYPDIYRGGSLFWEHVHDDWLEIPIELGFIGCAFLIVGAAYLAIFLIRRRSLWFSPIIPLIIGCGGTLVHAWADFPFQCPAILITWILVLTLAARYLEIERVQRLYSSS